MKKRHAESRGGKPRDKRHLNSTLIARTVGTGGNWRGVTRKTTTVTVFSFLFLIFLTVPVTKHSRHEGLNRPHCEKTKARVFRFWFGKVRGRRDVKFSRLTNFGPNKLTPREQKNEKQKPTLRKPYRGAAYASKTTPIRLSVKYARNCGVWKIHISQK